ncbi:MAG TPA: winged helix-turn-helix domain-containing protein [Rhodoblastus sp.]|nr:winged helix-turn-helix domain-containing protein [Rhodoblastus sp.]
MLLVGDDPGLRRLVGGILRRCHLSVFATEALERSLLATIEDKAAIAIVDLDAKAARALPAIEILKRDTSLPIVVLSSAYTRASHVLRALEADVDDLILKPFEGEDFRQRVFAAIRLRLRMRGESATYVWNGLRIDIAARSVWLNGAQVDLSGAEYAFLETLVRGGRRVATWNQLLKAIVPFSPRATEKSIPGLVWRLRRKIKAGVGDRSCVLVVRGIGYRLADLMRGNSQC